MLELITGGLLIMAMRVADVTLGTFRTLLIVQAKKYLAGAIGFVEVLIWIFAMSYVVQHLDNVFNLIAYAAGFGLGNILGITLEEKFAIGYAQVNVISKHDTDKIADALRSSKFGVTILPAEGSSAGMSILMTIIRRRDLKGVRNLIKSIDDDAFITVQHSRPYRGFIPGVRK